MVLPSRLIIAYRAPGKRSMATSEKQRVSVHIDTQPSIGDVFTGRSREIAKPPVSFFSLTGLGGRLYTAGSSQRSVSNATVASSFRKSAPENCATEPAHGENSKFFPPTDHNNVSFSGRSFHRFPTSMTIRSIMRDTGRALSFVAVVVAIVRRGRLLCSSYYALPLGKYVACEEKDARRGTMPIDERILTS